MIGASIDRALAVLLDDAAPGDPPPPTQLVHHVLTTGYAEALDLEAERLMAARCLERLLQTQSPPAADVEELTSRVAEIDARLAVLRRRLAELDHRFGSGAVRDAGRCA